MKNTEIDLNHDKLHNMDSSEIVSKINKMLVSCYTVKHIDVVEKYLQLFITHLKLSENEINGKIISDLRNNIFTKRVEISEL